MSTQSNGLANVGALGLGGCALSTFILNIVNAGLVRLGGDPHQQRARSNGATDGGT